MSWRIFDTASQITQPPCGFRNILFERFHGETSFLVGSNRHVGSLKYSSFASPAAYKALNPPQNSRRWS